MALPGSPCGPLRLHRLDRLKGLGKQHVFAKVGFYADLQPGDICPFCSPSKLRITSEVSGCCGKGSADVSVIRGGEGVLSPLGGWSPAGEAVGCSRETYRRLHFCPGLSLHRSGLSGEPEEEHPGYANIGPEEGELGLVNICFHLASLHQSGFLFCSHWPRAFCLGLFHTPLSSHPSRK